MSKRIKDQTLPANFTSGQILTDEDINKIILILREGVNANKADIDKLIYSNLSEEFVFHSKELADDYLETNTPEPDQMSIVFDYTNPNVGILLYKYVDGIWEFVDELNLLKFYNDLKIVKNHFEDIIDNEILQGVIATDIENKLNAKEQEYAPRLNALEKNKADKSALQALANGSPKGTYVNLAALQLAIPDGDNNIYITLDNGHWNYYDFNTNEWKSGGVYQENYGKAIIDIEQNSYIATANQKLLKVLGNTQSVEIIDIEPLSFGSYENKVIYVDGKPKVIEQVKKHIITEEDLDGLSGSVSGFKSVKLKKPADSQGYGNHTGWLYHIDGFEEFATMADKIPFGFIYQHTGLVNTLIYVSFPNDMTDDDVLEYLIGKELLYKIPDNEYFVVASLNSVKDFEIKSSNGTSLKINETLHKFNEDLVDEVELVDDEWVLKQYSNMYRCADLPSFGIGSARTFDSVYYFRWQYFERDNPQYQLDAEGIRLDGFEFGDIEADKKGIYVEAANLIIKIEKSIIDDIISRKGYTNNNEGRRLAGLDYFNENDLKIMFKYVTPITRIADVISNDLVINADDNIVITSETGVLPTLQVETTLGLTTIIEKVNNDLMQEISKVEQKIDNFEITEDKIKNWAITALESTRLKNIDFARNDTFTFVAVTDTHYKEYIPHLFKVIKQYEKKYGNIDAIMHHGDLIDGYGSLQETKLELLEVTKQLQELENPVLIAFGNHDVGSATNINRLVEDYMWNGLVLKPFQYRIKRVFDEVNNNSRYYYTDFEEQKIRVITLDVLVRLEGFGWTEEQLEWLINTALDFSSKENHNEWAVIIQCHMPTREEVNYYRDDQMPLKNAVEVENILKAFVEGSHYSSAVVNADFTSQGQMEVIMWVNGHGHLDILHKPADLYWYYVMTTNGHHIERSKLPAHLQGKSYVSLPEKVVGTINEFAFDIFNVDRVNRKVKITRVGAGNDREFTY